MAKDSFHKQLLASDEFTQYSLRSTFFVRRLRQMQLWEAIRDVGKLTKVRQGFPWTQRTQWGIEPEAWDQIAHKGIDPLLIFCHPRVLSEQPRLLVYYRTVALISQKGLSSLVGGNVAGTEAGKITRLNPDWLHRIVIALNSILSAVVRTAADIEARDLPGFQFASAGATIQGSWNNAIGAEGEAAVRTILVNHLRDEIVQIVWGSGSASDYRPELHTELIDRISEVRIVRMKHGYHLRFGSEPDMSLRGPDDIPLIAMEVKAGTDSAGALERLGAAMKSFESDRNINPRVKTVYIVRCKTPELDRRISQGNPFDHTFGLSDLLVNERTQRMLANLVLRVMLGQRRK